MRIPKLFCFFLILLLKDWKIFFSLYVLGEPAVHFCNFFLCCPSQRSARSQVPSLGGNPPEISSQLWAGETPNSNPGLQDNSLVRNHWATTPPYHWATTPPYHWATTPPLRLSYHASIPLSYHASLSTELPRTPPLKNGYNYFWACECV